MPSSRYTLKNLLSFFLNKRNVLNTSEAQTHSTITEVSKLPFIILKLRPVRELRPKPSNSARRLYSGVGKFTLVGWDDDDGD